VKAGGQQKEDLYTRERTRKDDTEGLECAVGIQESDLPHADHMQTTAWPPATWVALNQGLTCAKL
jgi:hypothetical protein